MSVGSILIKKELKRNIELRVRISKTEKNALYKFCLDNNISISDYVRAKVFFVINTKQNPIRKRINKI